MLREELGPEPVLVIPGVRPAGADVGDQKRIATPADVVRAGATHLVIGRPITRAENPAEAYDKIVVEISQS
jgi:orotidine-5'-phosphate decarboxylase